MKKWFSKFFEKETEQQDLLTLIEEIRDEISSITPINELDEERISNVKSVLDGAKLIALDITKRMKIIEAQIQTNSEK